MEVKKSKVALLTAGLAPKNFEWAAKRIIDASAKLYEFEEVLVLGAAAGGGGMAAAGGLCVVMDECMDG